MTSLEVGGQSYADAARERSGILKRVLSSYVAGKGDVGTGDRGSGGSLKLTDASGEAIAAQCPRGR